VHVYLIGTTRQWLLGRIEPGAIASLPILATHSMEARHSCGSLSSSVSASRRRQFVIRARN
jgi:hypothetical protein